MTDIAELFATDPLRLTREDRAAIIEEYRRARAQFNLGGKTTAAKAPKAATAPKGSEQIDIDELFA